MTLRIVHNGPLAARENIMGGCQIHRISFFVCMGGIALGVATAGCGSDGGGTGEVPPVTVLVTNDDGVDAPGIDALTEALRLQPGVEVIVVAPDGNRSGTSDTTTDGTVNGVPSATASGFAATAIDGFPADAVIFGLEQVLADDPPDLVMSGINAGQNLGCVIVDLSGTVGAARTAARLGVPAVAISQGSSDEPDFPSGVAAAIRWFESNRVAAAQGTLSTSTITNINIPTCAPGNTPRGSVEVPPAAEGNAFETPDCASTATSPTDDIAAFVAGFVAVTPDLVLQKGAACPSSP